MADINIPQKGGRRKMHSLRVDLTPMVDLGFLLISFFMYTTTMAHPKAMEIDMPFISEKKTAFTEESTITLIPAKDHKVLYYPGTLDESKVGTTDFKNDDLRKILLAAQKRAAALPARFSKEAHLLHVIIKPAENSTYDDMVKTVDEMEIPDVHYYAIADLTADEQHLLTKKLQ
ncbi:ExbD/TolR family protein [Chitinophagaceae bacterium MMS25-I14]